MHLFHVAKEVLKTKKHEFLSNEFRTDFFNLLNKPAAVQQSSSKPKQRGWIKMKTKRVIPFIAALEVVFVVTSLKSQILYSSFCFM